MASQAGAQAGSQLEDDIVHRRIIEATDIEIDRRGLVGMRVADVADRADTTIALIYRRFADRDGLVAATFAAHFEHRLLAIIAIAEGLLDRPGPLTVDDLVNATPPLRYEGSELIRHRMQRIHVTAMENLALRLALREIAGRLLPRFDAALQEVADRFPPDQRFDPRIFTYFVLRHNGIIDDVLGDQGLSNDEYRDFLRQLLVDSMRPDAERD